MWEKYDTEGYDSLEKEDIKKFVLEIMGNPDPSSEEYEKKFSEEAFEDMYKVFDPDDTGLVHK